MTDEVLVASDVKARLFAALDPVLVLVNEAARGRCDPRSLRLVLQLHPLVVQVTQTADEGRAARRIVAFAANALSDGGAALDAAVNEFASGVLSAMPTQAAEASLVHAAVARDGGLCVLVNPQDETAVLFCAEGDLGKGVVLGGLTDAPETWH